jgi:hypothetical protein
MAPEAPLRASDQDRQEAVLALSDEYAEGRLDREEFDRRQALALEATYLHDLDPLFADLPGRVSPTHRAAGPDPSERARRAPRPAAVAAFGLASAVGTVALVAITVGALVNGHLLWLLLPLLAFMVARRARRRAFAYAVARSGGAQGQPALLPAQAFAHYGGAPPWHGHHRGRR